MAAQRLRQRIDHGTTLRMAVPAIAAQADGIDEVEDRWAHV